MTAVASGNLLYLMVAALLALFWRHRRGHAHEHHRVHRVLGLASPQSGRAGAPGLDG